jgi:hypothetical protein
MGRGRGIALLLGGVLLAASSSLLAQEAEPAAAPLDEPAEGEPVEAETVPAATDSPRPPWTAAQLAAAEAARAQRLARAKQIMAAEPEVRLVQQVALEHFRVDPNALDRLRHLLRAKGGAPVVVLSQKYENLEARRHYTIASSLPQETNRTDDSHRGQRLRSAAVLSMDVPQAIFNTSHLQTYTFALIQRHVLVLVLQTYYIRRQLQLRLLVDPPADPRAYTSLSLRVRASTGILDSYTGGWFSQNLPAGSE